MQPSSAVLCLCGLPGTGKSYIAAVVANDTGAIVLSTDELRRHDLDAGIPFRAVKSYYKLMLSELDKRLSRGENCILDATFSKRVWRMQAARIIASGGAAGFLLEVKATRSMATSRLSRRSSPREGVVDEAVYDSIDREFDPVLDDEKLLWFWYGVAFSLHWDPTTFYRGAGRGFFHAR